MYNLLKNIFGFPDDGDDPRRRSGNPLRDDLFNQNRGDNIQDRNDISFSPGNGFWSFGKPIMANPFEIDKQFQRLISEMEEEFRKFDFGNFQNSPFRSIIFDDPGQQKVNSNQSLRDYYLKEPGCVCDQGPKRDYILDGQVNFNDVNNLLKNGTNTAEMAVTPFKPPEYNLHYQCMDVRVTIQPDGSGEVVQKIKDSSGKVETIIKKFSSSK